MSFIVLLALLLFGWLIWRLARPPRIKPRSAAILVLGDIGRSPRIMYHAQSLAENNFETHLIGYGGSRPIPLLEGHQRVHFHYLSEPPAFLKHMPFVLAAPIKVIHQIFGILVALLVRVSDAPEYILVQGVDLSFDWHNLGYSILALRLGPNNPLVKIAKRLEATFGRSAYAHLFVTQAMRNHLVHEWDLRGHIRVLYDRPPRHFHRASDQETHELFKELHPALCAQTSLLDFLPQHSSPHSTPFTYTTPQVTPSLVSEASASVPLTRPVFTHRVEIATPSVTPTSPIATSQLPIPLPALRPDRPALLVSSTSWTPDEDFDILLNALCMYELRADQRFKLESKDGEAEQGVLPKMLVIITGKGPLKGHYMEKVAKLQKDWKWVRCISLWLEPDDYPVLLGSADVGICLHASSSAMDLPMKIVDMFGCGLPVCALGFSCIGELVKDGFNGLIFKNASQLAEQLEELLLSFPNSTRLHNLRSSLISPSRAKTRAQRDEHQWEWSSWEENWNRVVRPLIAQSG
ncbi:mannosyltransferase [Amanita rubescens]|nr:mannosyltransferase [Amanita rubescens]